VGSGSYRSEGSWRETGEGVAVALAEQKGHSSLVLATSAGVNFTGGRYRVVGMNDYPNSIDELDLDAVQFPPAAIEAMRRLARSCPWRGTIAQRKRKLLRLNADLAAAYRVPAPRVVFGLIGDDSGRSCYVPALNTIILRGTDPSVITLTHEIFHCILGPSEREVCRASLSLFKRCFPRTWKRLRFDGHMARANSRSRDVDGGHS
jgi:hypothetical protein